MMREHPPGVWLLLFAAQIVILLLFWGKNLERGLRLMLGLIPGR
ncbi:MAG: hypothetical protein ACP5OO_10570 [Chloroflexia bacterium]